LGVCFVDFTENVSVRDGNNVRKVEFFKITLVSSDLDERFEYKAFKVAPNQVLLVVPAAPSLLRPVRYAEYSQALQGSNTSTVLEHETRIINMNAMDTPRRQSRLFVLHFPDDMELEMRYSQSQGQMPLPNQIKRLLNPVVTMNEAGGQQTITEISFHVSVVPLDERIVDQGQAHEVDKLAELRQNLMNQARLQGQQQQPQPMQVPSAFGEQQAYGMLPQPPMQGQQLFNAQQQPAFNAQQQPAFNAQQQQQALQAQAQQQQALQAQAQQQQALQAQAQQQQALQAQAQQQQALQAQAQQQQALQAQAQQQQAQQQPVQQQQAQQAAPAATPAAPQGTN
jgi:hypothetical protein